MNVEFPEPTGDETPAWESAPVTYDLDFHERLMTFLLYRVSTRDSLILADQLNKRMGNSARRRLHDATEKAKGTDNAER